MEGKDTLPGSCHVSRSASLKLCLLHGVDSIAEEMTTKAENSNMENWGILYCRLTKSSSKPCPYKEHALLKLLKIKTGVIY